MTNTNKLIKDLDEGLKPNLNLIGMLSNTKSAYSIKADVIQEAGTSEGDIYRNGTFGFGTEPVNVLDIDKITSSGLYKQDKYTVIHNQLNEKAIQIVYHDSGIVFLRSRIGNKWESKKLLAKSSNLSADSGIDLQEVLKNLQLDNVEDDTGQYAEGSDLISSLAILNNLTTDIDALVNKDIDFNLFNNTYNVVNNLGTKQKTNLVLNQQDLFSDIIERKEKFKTHIGLDAVENEYQGNMGSVGVSSKYGTGSDLKILHSEIISSTNTDTLALKNNYLSDLSGSSSDSLNSTAINNIGITINYSLSDLAPALFTGNSVSEEFNDIFEAKRAELGESESFLDKRGSFLDLERSAEEELTSIGMTNILDKNTYYVNNYGSDGFLAAFWLNTVAPSEKDINTDSLVPLSVDFKPFFEGEIASQIKSLPETTSFAENNSIAQSISVDDYVYYRENGTKIIIHPQFFGIKDEELVGIMQTKLSFGVTYPEKIFHPFGSSILSQTLNVANNPNGVEFAPTNTCMRLDFTKRYTEAKSYVRDIIEPNKDKFVTMSDVLNTLEWFMIYLKNGTTHTSSQSNKGQNVLLLPSGFLPTADGNDVTNINKVIWVSSRDYDDGVPIKIY